MPRGGHGGGGHRGGHAPRFRHAGPHFIRRRRPLVVGGGYVWNGLYWVSPQGLCYTKDDDGNYTLVDCAPVVVSEFNGTEGSSNEVGKGGTGGTMDSSMFTGELREGGPLNKKNIRDTLIGVGIGILLYMAYKKLKK